MKWLEALKAWNSSMKSKNPLHKYKIPKKGSKEYMAVKKMMGAKPTKK